MNRRQTVATEDLGDCRVLTVSVEHNKDSKSYVVVARVEEVKKSEYGVTTRVTRPFFDPYETFQVEDTLRFSSKKLQRHADAVASNEGFIARLKRRYKSYYEEYVPEYVPTAGERPSFRKFADGNRLGNSPYLTSHNYDEVSS